MNVYAYDPGRSFLPPDLAGSCMEDAGKSPDPAGKHGKYLEHGSSIPAWNFSDFFSDDFRTDSARKH
jgi:hypothetical protein